MSKLHKKYGGVVVPMITPFTRELNVDQQAVEQILGSFLNAGVSPFVAGTTGESLSMTEAQKLLLIRSTVSFVNHKTTVYAGISGNCIHDAIENAKKYAELGVDVVVAHLPFYYPIDADQMLKYFEQMADHVPCPLILYNIPVTTKQSIPLDVIEKLSHHPNIAGIKDSERGMERLDQALELWKDRVDFVHFMGTAVQSSYALLHGSDGIIPSTGNIIPGLYARMVDAAWEGEINMVNELQEKTNLISEIYQKNRTLSQSIPALKVMMSLSGLCEPYTIPPMYMPEVKEQKLIEEEMEKILKPIILEYQIIN